MNHATYNMDGPTGLRTMIESIQVISHVSISIYDPQFRLLVTAGDPDAASQRDYWINKIPELNRNSPNLRLLPENMAEAAAAVTTDKKDLIAYAVISDFYFDAKANPHIKQFRNGCPLLDETVIRSASNMIALSIKCCLLDLVTVDPSLQEKVDEYIANNLEKKITIRMLSGALKVKKDTLIALFHDELNTTLPKYLYMKRIEQAQRMLAETDLSIEDISKKIGMAENLWTRLFKKYVFVAPDEYRKSSQ